MSYPETYEQRTTLSWSRTALSFAVVPVVAGKLAFDTAPWFGIGVVAIGILLGLIGLRWSGRRLEHSVDAPAVLTLATLSMGVMMLGLIWVH